MSVAPGLPVFCPYILKQRPPFLDFFLLKVADSAQFEPYFPFIKNFCNHIAVHLENRHQRERLHVKHEELLRQHEDLEKLIQVRNRELVESEEKFSTAFRSAPLLMTISSLDDGTPGRCQ